LSRCEACGSLDRCSACCDEITCGAAQAAKRGDWVLLDEINLAPQDTLQRLSGLLDATTVGQGGLSLTERGEVETIAVHPSFRLFAAMNPPTDAGKKEMPTALRNRFTEVRGVALKFAVVCACTTSVPCLRLQTSDIC
jgi:MoxR-like ATPase